MPYKNILTSLGLSEPEAAVYDALLELGLSPASAIIKKTGLKRGHVYHLLYGLIEKGLAEQTEKNKKAHFRALSPSKLLEFVDQQIKTVSDSKKTLESILPSLLSVYRLTSEKPIITFYEGDEGMKKVLSDTLFNNPEKNILTFSDVAGYTRYLREWNENYYAVQRKKLKIYEKVIIPNNREALDYMRGYKANDVTEILFIDHKLFPFFTEINIYNNRVSFVTFSDKAKIGVLVENKEIYQTLTSIFNLVWEAGRKYNVALQPDWLQSQIRKKD